MKRLTLTALLLTIALSAFSQQPIDSLIAIDEVAIVGRRPMKQIGVQRTEFEEVALKEHIALSMADVLTYNSSVFVKSYGRATLSTVAFRGTSPSHTQRCCLSSIERKSTSRSSSSMICSVTPMSCSVSMELK